MSNSFFRFKQFTVYQDKCAMKVGTDGVLLGAWADVANCSQILDVGTGTGLIALMLAQRNTSASVKAIDVDEACIMQAQQNVSISSFSNRVEVASLDFQRSMSVTHVDYDLIVSNPPYFRNALKSPQKSRSRARHDDSLSFFDILSQGASLLNDNGRIALILPHEFKKAVIDHALVCNLYVNRITNVFPLPHKPAKRLLIEFSKSKAECIENNLTIELARHQYSADFKTLTQEFYLDK